jgi:hypothetical protein
MPGRGRDHEQAVRVAAYFIWEREGRPHGRAHVHWHWALVEQSGKGSGRGDRIMGDEEKLLAGRPDVNFPALLTKDVMGG